MYIYSISCCDISWRKKWGSSFSNFRWGRRSTALPRDNKPESVPSRWNSLSAKLSKFLSSIQTYIIEIGCIKTKLRQNKEYTTHKFWMKKHCLNWKIGFDIAQSFFIATLLFQWHHQPASQIKSGVMHRRYKLPRRVVAGCSLCSFFFGLPGDTEKCSSSLLLHLKVDFTTGVKILTNWNYQVKIWFFGFWKLHY